MVLNVLRWLNTGLKCTMGQHRLQHLALLSVEKEGLCKLSHSEVIDPFCEYETDGTAKNIDSLWNAGYIHQTLKKTNK